MNTAATKPMRWGISLFSGLRGKLIILALVFAITIGVATQAKAYWVYNYTPYGDNVDWSWSGNYCRSTQTSDMNFNTGGSPGWWRTRAKQTFGWGTGQPWCDGIAAKGWIYRTGGSWLQGSWTTAYNGHETPPAYSPNVTAGGVQVIGQGQYQAYHNGSWSTFFRWGDTMYPPTLY